jgi:serine/threonine-protein kinase
MTKGDAQQAIEDAGLKVSEFVVRDTPDQKKDQVIETVPPAREAVAKGTGIVVHIASGNVKVPDNLVGQDWAVVANLLSDLTLVARKEEVDSDKTPGTVLEVANAGSAVALGSEVVVKVAKAPTPVPSTTTVTVPPPTPTETEPLPLPTTPPPADG